jgi:lambda family phage minor tail protein L
MLKQSPFTNDKVLAPLFAEETAKAEQAQLFHLITVILPSPEEPLRIVDSNYDIRFAGLTYSRFPVKFAGASVSTDGTIDKASIAVANVHPMMMGYVEAYNGLRNCRLLVKTVYANVLDDTYVLGTDGTVFPNVALGEVNPNPTACSSAYLEDEFLIDNYTANEMVVNFQLDPIIDLEIRVPRRRFMLDSCYWDYKDPHTCKYAGSTYAAISCNKNLADCQARGNAVNFGGFPGISGSRRVLL